jgi:hypothetical protein
MDDTIRNASIRERFVMFMWVLWKIKPRFYVKFYWNRWGMYWRMAEFRRKRRDNQ